MADFRLTSTVTFTIRIPLVGVFTGGLALIPEEIGLTSGIRTADEDNQSLGRVQGKQD